MKNREQNILLLYRALSLYRENCKLVAPGKAGIKREQEFLQLLKGYEDEENSLADICKFYQNHSANSRLRIYVGKALISIFEINIPFKRSEHGLLYIQSFEILAHEAALAEALHVSIKALLNTNLELTTFSK